MSETLARQNPLTLLRCYCCNQVCDPHVRNEYETFTRDGQRLAVHKLCVTKLPRVVSNYIVCQCGHSHQGHYRLSEECAWYPAKCACQKYVARWDE